MSTPSRTGTRRQQQVSHLDWTRGPKRPWTKRLTGRVPSMEMVRFYLGIDDEEDE